MEAKNKPMDATVAIAVFIVVFVVYLLTLCPTIYPGPSGDAVCGVVGAGLTPATSNPIWLILCRLFGGVSSNTAYTLNLMSAFFGALTIALLYALLCQFTHTRTAEEEARYQTHPFLNQLLALSAALLVAFCHPFWEGSVLAGPDTLNTFFLVLLVFLLALYLKTSKSRYMIVFALVYGVAIGNYPTLFVLAPLFALFLLLKCRSLLEDPVAVVLMLILFGVGLLPSLYEPRLYVLQAKGYVLKSNTFGQAFSAYLDSYFRSMKLLFFQRRMFQGWFFWLFIPTFVPLMCLAMKGGDYERGGRTATKLTYLVRYLFFVAFMIGGLGYLWGFGLEPVKIADLNYLRDSRYLGAYVVVGAWLSYVMGYWIIVATGKFKPTGTDPEPKQKFRKVSYVVATVIVLALPVLGFFMNLGRSTKRHATHVERYALGLLKSSPDNAIIVVPIRPFFGSIGAPLRYFQLQRDRLSPGEGKTIIDLNAAYLDYLRVKSIEIERYLAETVLGRRDPQPRKYFSPEQPFTRVYDGILRCEAVRAYQSGEPLRPICGLLNNFLWSSLPGNDVMNKDYRAEPSGLLYVYRSRSEYRDSDEIINDNESLWTELWGDLAVTDDPSPQKSRSEVEDYILGEYSKSANDFGVFCQLGGQLDLAEKYYSDRALVLLPDSASALWNMAFLMKQRGDTEGAETFINRFQTAVERQLAEPQLDPLRRFGLPADLNLLVQEEKRLEQEGKQNTESQRLAFLQLAADIAPTNSSVREKLGTLRETIGDRLLAADAVFNEQTAQAEFLQARIDYTAALERAELTDKPRTRRILGRLGGVYAKLGDNTQAEKFFKRAVAPDDLSSQLRLMRLYLSTGRNLGEVKSMASKIIERTVADEREKATLTYAQKEAASFTVRALLTTDGTDAATQFLKGYIADHTEQADILLSLAAQLRKDVAVDALTAWLLEEHARIREDKSAASLAQLAEIYFRQQQFESLSKMTAPPGAVSSLDLVKFHYFQGMGSEATGKRTEAERSYERALSFLPEEDEGMGVVIANNLSWLYFKNGKLAEAEKLASETLDKAPANPAVWDTYGWILYKAGKNLDKTIKLVERSHLANPEVGIIAYHYGKLLIEKGDGERGIALLRWAVESGLQGEEELQDANRLIENRL